MFFVQLLTQVGHGVHPWRPALSPEDLDGGGRDNEENRQRHRETHQQGEVRLQDAILGCVEGKKNIIKPSAVNWHIL